MSKRLKRRIREHCGLDSLSKEERLELAKSILDDTSKKQAICNEILGTSFKDIEKVMRDVIDERKPSKHQQEYDELVSEVPEKIYPELQKQHSRPSGIATGTTLVPLLDREEVARLLNESRASKADLPAAEPQPQSYRTYSIEEVAALIAGNYHPDMFKYRKRNE